VTGAGPEAAEPKSSAADAITKHRVDTIAEEPVARLGQPERIASAVRWLA
jgi:NAD(P)-dependent dehydrogenase (short-subunit alcohol dehydrogenase family)